MSENEENSSQLELENENKETNVEIKRIIESILFVAKYPVEPIKLTKILKDDFLVSKKQISGFIDELNEEYEKCNHAFRIAHIAGGYQLKTSSHYTEWIKKFLKEKSHEKLSKPALETLSIVAYKQPLSRADIEKIRGVNVDGTIRQLLDKDLIYVSGKKDSPGKPSLYSTTKTFLMNFGLKSLQELPPLGELNLN